MSATAGGVVTRPIGTDAQHEQRDDAGARSDDAGDARDHRHRLPLGVEVRDEPDRRLGVAAHRLQIHAAPAHQRKREHAVGAEPRERAER